MKKFIILIFVVVFTGVLAGVFSAFFVLNSENSKESLIKNFYLTETEVYVSPHSLRLKMDSGVNDYILVDLRSQEEYEKEHIIGAINIPAYKNKTTSAYGETERIVNEFSKLQEDKEIIVYCYSIPCMSGRKIGRILAENGIYVKHLGIGWNEWRYFWNLWNHEHEWNQTTVMDYIATGKEPGTPKMKNAPSICTEGDFGC